MDAEKIELVIEIIQSVLNEYYNNIDGRKISASDTFNNGELIAGEDAENIFREIAFRLHIDEHEFFSKIDIRSVFEIDYGIAFLPFALIIPFLRNKKHREIRAISVRDFATRVVAEFKRQIP